MIVIVIVTQKEIVRKELRSATSKARKFLRQNWYEEQILIAYLNLSRILHNHFISNFLLQNCRTFGVNIARNLLSTNISLATFGMDIFDFCYEFFLKQKVVCFSSNDQLTSVNDENIVQV